MTREEAKQIIYEVINSGIISSELEDNLTELCNHLCRNDFAECEGSHYCEGCSFKKED